MTQRWHDKYFKRSTQKNALYNIYFKEPTHYGSKYLLFVGSCVGQMKISSMSSKNT